MIQEYLLLDNTQKDALEAYKPEGVTVKLFSANEGKCWYAQFRIDGEKEKTAKKLSDVDEYVRDNFKVTLLENGSAAYFCGRLYPLVSRFEYLLRKLLYLTSAINENNKSTGNISDLESKTFGEIFTMLFIDDKFMSKIKDEVKSRNRDKFSKAEIIALIQSADENTVWDELLGVDVAPTLRSRFHDVKDYRNDVMHSHPINWRKYQEIQKLYCTINSEIDEAIHAIEVTENMTSSKPEFNEILERALTTQEQFAKMTESLQAVVEQIHEQIYIPSAAILGLQEQIKRSIPLDNTAMIRALQEIAKSLKFFQDDSAVQEADIEDDNVKDDGEQDDEEGRPE